MLPSRFLTRANKSFTTSSISVLMKNSAAMEKSFVFCFSNELYDSSVCSVNSFWKFVSPVICPTFLSSLKTLSEINLIIELSTSPKVSILNSENTNIERRIFSITISRMNVLMAPSIPSRSIEFGVDLPNPSTIGNKSSSQAESVIAFFIFFLIFSKSNKWGWHCPGIGSGVKSTKDKTFKLNNGDLATWFEKAANVSINKFWWTDVLNLSRRIVSIETVLLGDEIPLAYVGGTIYVPFL